MAILKFSESDKKHYEDRLKKILEGKLVTPEEAAMVVNKKSLNTKKEEQIVTKMLEDIGSPKDTFYSTICKPL